jgi:hypothetical protein
MLLNYLTLPEHTCTECRLPADVYFQSSPDSETFLNGESRFFAATCRNETCDLYTVTLEPQHLDCLTEVELESYRRMNDERRASAALRRQQAILTFAYNRAVRKIYGAQLTVAAASDYKVTPDELEAPVEADFAVRVGTIFPSYFITPKGCELIEKPFAALGRMLSVHYQSETCVALIRAVVDLEGVVEPERLRKCLWYIERMDARNR